MQWDRFDICEAWWLYASLNHGGQWSRLYAKLSQLVRMGFSPRVLLRSYSDLSVNGREIYDLLEARGK